MGNILELDHVTEKTSEQGSTGYLRYAASGMKGWRVTMEDCHTLCGSIPVDGQVEPLQEHSLFAVYDGHGGGLTSRFAGENFMKLLSMRPEIKKYAALPKEGNKSQGDVTGIDLLRTSLKATFKDIDAELRKVHIEKNEEYAREEEEILRQAAEEKHDPDDVREEAAMLRKIERSGSTIVVVLVTPTHIMCANAGDSRAILRRDGKALPLSFDHKPSNLPELERIMAAGGFVKSKRVDGDLAVSRGLGDFAFKAQPTLPHSKQKVIFDPDVLVYPRDRENDEFVILACDGVWDVATNEQCSDMIQAILDEGETDIVLVAEEVLDMCLERNSRDNMTMVMVCFPGIKMKTTKSSNVVSNRRSARKARILEAQAKVAAEKAVKNIGLDFSLGGFTGAKKTKSGDAAASLRLDEPSQKRSI
jgi:serine/threonine protein phosphatase PrpC